MAPAYNLTPDEIRAVFHKVFDTPEGEMVLDLLEDFSGVSNGDLIRDLKQLVYMQGRRSVTLKIREILNSNAEESNV